MTGRWSRRAVAALAALAVLLAVACSSGAGDKAACEDLSTVGISNADYGRLFKDHRDLSDELRSALKDLERDPSAADRASKVAGLCARDGVTVNT